MLNRFLSSQVLILCLSLLILNAYCWNQLAKCKDSKLFVNKRIDSLRRSIQIRGRTDLSNIIGKAQNDSLFNYNTYLTDMSTLDGTSALGRCKNFIISGKSCCQKDSFEALYNALEKSIIGTWWEYYYLIHEYAIWFVGRVTDPTMNCLSGANPRLDRNVIQAQLNKYAPILQKIKEEDLQFLKQTACLLCLGPKDFSTFIYPNYDPSSENTLNKGNFVIYDKAYYIDRINRYANYLVQLQSLHAETARLILMYARGIIRANCPYNQFNLFLDQKYINSLKRCSNFQQCKKVAINYLGEAGIASFYLHISNPVNAQLPPDFYFSQRSTYGFRGNTTYTSNYESQYLPDAKRFKMGYTLPEVDLSQLN